MTLSTKLPSLALLQLSSLLVANKIFSSGRDFYFGTVTANIL